METVVVVVVVVGESNVVLVADAGVDVSARRWAPSQLTARGVERDPRGVFSNISSLARKLPVLWNAIE